MMLNRHLLTLSVDGAIICKGVIEVDNSRAETVEEIRPGESFHGTSYDALKELVDQHDGAVVVSTKGPQLTPIYD